MQARLNRLYEFADCRPYNTVAILLLILLQFWHQTSTCTSRQGASCWPNIDRLLSSQSRSRILLAVSGNNLPTSRSSGCGLSSFSLLVLLLHSWCLPPPPASGRAVLSRGAIGARVSPYSYRAQAPVVRLFRWLLVRYFALGHLCGLVLCKRCGRLLNLHPQSSSSVCTRTTSNLGSCTRRKI
jgi:hypothetical protein